MGTGAPAVARLERALAQGKVSVVRFVHASVEADFGPYLMAAWHDQPRLDTCQGNGLTILRHAQEEQQKPYSRCDPAASRRHAENI